MNKLIEKKFVIMDKMEQASVNLQIANSINSIIYEKIFMKETPSESTYRMEYETLNALAVAVMDYLYILNKLIDDCMNIIETQNCQSGAQRGSQH